MKPNYEIFTDSSSDLDVELQQQLQVHVVPLSVKIAGRSYRNYTDEREIKNADFYQLMRSGEVGTTSQVNAYEFVEEFKPYLEKGIDIFYLGFSSALSGTYNSFLIAKEELKELYPDRKIIGVDTLSASLGQGLLTYHAVQQKKNKTIEQLEAWVLENRLNIVHLFTVDDLNHLKRGGRISGTAAMVGTMLKLKPLMHMDDLGRLVAYGKVLGRKNALKHLVERMGEVLETSDQPVFISHGDCLEEAKYVAEEIQASYGIKEFHFNYVGPVIGAHSGPGTIAIFFRGKQR